MTKVFINAWKKIGSTQLRLHLKTKHNIDDEEIQIDIPCYEGKIVHSGLFSINL